MNPFRASRYLRHLRDACAGADGDIPPHVAEALQNQRLLVCGPEAPRFLRQIAWLCACGVLDARFDCLLLPVLVEGSGELLPRMTGDWPEVDWRERLESGGCLLLLDGADAASVLREVEAWPACRVIAALRGAGSAAQRDDSPLRAHECLLQAGFQVAVTPPLLQSSFTWP